MEIINSPLVARYFNSLCEETLICHCRQLLYIFMSKQLRLLHMLRAHFLLKYLNSKRKLLRRKSNQNNKLMLCFLVSLIGTYFFCVLYQTVELSAPPQDATSEAQTVCSGLMWCSLAYLANELLNLYISSLCFLLINPDLQIYISPLTHDQWGAQSDVKGLWNLLILFVPNTSQRRENVHLPTANTSLTSGQPQHWQSLILEWAVGAELERCVHDEFGKLHSWVWLRGLLCHSHGDGFKRGRLIN